MNEPKLTLVGAGPGDPELFTVKGVKALQKADVVLYDALVDSELLKYAPLARKVFVGKRKGIHHKTQDEINEMIVKYALNYGNVVRLKGGDPFIFGRGNEEIEYAASFGISTDVVSGISSCTAVPTCAGISLTHRNIAQSFWVITGTTSENKLSNDVQLAAKSTATVVILMGMGKMEEIVSCFVHAGKGDLPVAVVQNGTTSDEKWGMATIKTLQKMVFKKQLGNPAIIIIGEVVALSSKWKDGIFSYFEKQKSGLVEI
ncbi:MAG: uroporphyrinogen-III C-methyltransferase [Cyclobacteriaceae bacterium]|nr:uroporphyrinogen-III C-methyltransferase [Cyclobacteriaceae bacterium]